MVSEPSAARVHMKIWIGDITFDVSDPKAMAEFWAAALHFRITEITDALAIIAAPSGRSPRCSFQKVATPKLGKNRIHLDLFAGDMEAEVARLESLGAKKLRVDRDGAVVWTVMVDVEGNEFCVQPPQN